MVNNLISFVSKKKILLITGSLVLGIILAILILLKQSSTVLVSVLSLGIIGISFPYFLTNYFAFRDIRAAEDAYPNFLRDLAQSVSSGLTLPQAISTASQTEYGALTKYIVKLNTSLAWGTPFPEAWQKFTKLLAASEMISRINGIILESFYSGGDIAAVLNSLCEDVDTIKRMEADKRAMMLQHLAVMYVIFGVFLSIIVILYKVLLPILYLQRFGSFSGIAFRPTEILDINYFKNLFFIMTLIQAGSLGVMAGQIVEEKLIAGFKHIIIMLAIGIIVFFIFIFPSKVTFNLEVTPQMLGIGQSYTVSGNIYVETEPAGGARIEIIDATGQLTTLFADSLGQFTTNFKAPTQPGTYQVSVLFVYGSESGTQTKTIVVS